MSSNPDSRRWRAPNRARWIRGAIGPAAGPWRLIADPHMRLPDLHAWHPFTEGRHSKLYQLELDTPILAKFIQPRSQPRDSLRKYINAQARREWHSAQRLTDAGLTTPAVFGWAHSLSPFARYESILFMEKIDGYRSSLQFIRQARDHAARQQFFATLATDMACLHGHGLVHKDGHFDNIGRLGQQSLIWIDNDIRYAGTPKALVAGFRRMRTILHRTARDAVSEAEWRYFDHRLRTELARWPRAGILIDEV